MYVDEFVSGEREVEAAAQRHLPQFLGRLVSVETVVAQEEADCRRDRQQSACSRWENERERTANAAVTHRNWCYVSCVKQRI